MAIFFAVARTWLACTVLSMALVAPASALGFRPAPLPENMSMMQAAPQVPAAVKGMVGRWEGTIIGGGEQAEHIFVVERLEPTWARIVWSVGESPGGGAGWARRGAVLANGNALTVQFKNSTVTYTLQADGTLLCLIDLQGFIKKAVLRKTAEPTVPYAAETMQWPDMSSTLKPGVSTSEVRVSFPEKLVLAMPGPDVPTDRAKWAGRFEGWACREATCDIKLAVLKIEGDEAEVVELIGSAAIQPSAEVRKASFVGDELQIRSNGLRVNYRMRADGIVEMHRVVPTGGFQLGVLTKVP